MNNCSYIEDTNIPCSGCPRLITALHMCNLLQEIQNEQEEDINQPRK